MPMLQLDEEDLSAADILSHDEVSSLCHTPNERRQHKLLIFCCNYIIKLSNESLQQHNSYLQASTILKSYVGLVHMFFIYFSRDFLR